MRRQLMMGAGIFSGIFIILLGIVLSGCGGGGGGGTGPTPTPSGPTPTPMVVEITANITTPTTWTGGNVYLIRKYDFYVMSTLTINAGAVIKFHPTDGPYLMLGSGGRIVANGLSSNKIYFTSYEDDAHGGDTNGNGAGTSPQAGDWGYIGTNGYNNSSFNYCCFYYGGSTTYDCTLQIYSSSATVTNCTFAHNLGEECGVLDADDALAGTVIQSNTFYDNEKPLAIDTKYNIDDSNVFHNPSNSAQKNTYNGIFLWSPNHITTNITWGETEVAFMVESSFWVNSGSGKSLHLNNNVVVKFESGVTLSHYNNITYGSGAAFTSYRDDSRKGDTNGDGSSFGANFDWDGIWDDTIPGHYESAGWPIYFDSH